MEGENKEGMEVMVSEQTRFSFSNSYMYVGAFSVCTIVLTYLQYLVLRRHLHARKYI